MTTRLSPYETVIFVKAPCSIEPDRLSFALRVTAVNPFIGYRSQPEQGLSRDPPSLFPRSVAGCDRLPVILSFSHNVRETSKTTKGFGRKLLSRRRHFSYHAWSSGKGISPLGPTTSDSDAIRARDTGLCSEAYGGFIVISDMRSGQSLCCYVYAEY